MKYCWGNHEMMISDTFEIIHYDIYHNIHLYHLFGCEYVFGCVYVFEHTNYGNLSSNLDFPLMKWF